MNFTNKLLLLNLCIFAMSAHTGTAITTVLYVDAQAGSGSISGQSTEANITSVSLARGPQLNPETTFSAYYDSANWSTSLTFPGTESGAYVSFQFEVASGYTFDPTGLSFYYEEGGNERGPLLVDLRSSSDNFASSLYLDTDAWDQAVESVGDVDLAPVNGFVEYRFYGYAAISATGLLGFTNNTSIDYEGSAVTILMEGDLQPIPEVGQTGLICAIASLMLIGHRRFRRPA
jgi:hypothetical protein